VLNQKKIFILLQITVSTSLETGKYFKETGKIIINGVACDEEKLSCKDTQFGTFAWNKQEVTCANTHSEVYSGLAQIYRSNQNKSTIAVISNDEQRSFAGM
jgi:hypothetical protein